MSNNLTSKRGNEHSRRKPLKHLTESQTNQTMQTAPFNSTQVRLPALPPASEEASCSQREHQTPYSPPRLPPSTRLHNELYGANHRNFTPGMYHGPVSYPHQSVQYSFGHASYNDFENRNSSAMARDKSHGEGFCDIGLIMGN